MKFQYENNLEYQQSAIEAVVGLFHGQERAPEKFNFKLQSDMTSHQSPGLGENEHGIGNILRLSDEDLEKNLQSIQLRNDLPISETLESGNFTVEMETGTGKTYVYLRTIFELNKRFGFAKFVIVVPSIAIKEGTYKTLQTTREHIENLYPEAKGYEYFQYDSTKLGKVWNFSKSANVQIMVVTVGAINRQDTNNLYKINENTGDIKPIDLIKSTNPIVIVDEPQSVDGGLNGQGKKALDQMNPLCTLRYSATHVDKHHMIYRLDAVEAYEKELVKQIEVASLEVTGGFNKPYVKLLSTLSDRGTVVAKIEADVQEGKKVSRQIFTVEEGDDLEQETGRNIYKNFRIGKIYAGKTRAKLELSFPNGEIELCPGDDNGTNPEELKRLMINRTIKEHLEKELRFKALNLDVKVLSLFFIDKVEFYRQYDENGNSVKGKYAKFFEEELRELASEKKYQKLFEGFDFDGDIDKIHDGYFSIDKRGTWTETADNNQHNRENAERAYNLIMKEKERLLSFDSKLKFIFSHSALKEGWDNPNVFQICALREIGTERERRQTIGRGLRLCVNQEGQRLYGFDKNTLTVIAAESYEQFAENLQKEIEDDTGIRFGVLDKHRFTNLIILESDGIETTLATKRSEQIWQYLSDQGYIDLQGKALDDLRLALREDKLELPEEFMPYLDGVKNILRKLVGKIEIKNADERVVIKTKKSVLESEEFKSLWNRIKHKTTYRVNFDNNKLINDCMHAIEELPPVTKTRARIRKTGVIIGEEGVKSGASSVSEYRSIDEKDIEMPNLFEELQENTQLTRRSLYKILIGCKRLKDFKKNPQIFIELATEAINRTKRLILVEGIKYQRIGDEHYYAQELFDEEELTGYLKHTVESQKSVYDRVIYDSIGVEKRFADELEANESIKVYTKLPSWFKVPTPLGSYNPDWAILVEEKGLERLYLVVETKFSIWWDDLRSKEGAKIKCGEKHFSALTSDENPAIFIKAADVEGVLGHIED